MQLIEVFEDDLSVYVIMELLSGGEVFHRIQEEEFFTEKEASEIIIPVIDAVRYCHEMGICHRDLKVIFPLSSLSLRIFYIHPRMVSN